jgi:hypothetical protein
MTSEKPPCFSVSTRRSSRPATKDLSCSHGGTREKLAWQPMPNDTAAQVSKRLPEGSVRTPGRAASPALQSELPIQTCAIFTKFAHFLKICLNARMSRRKGKAMKTTLCLLFALALLVLVTRHAEATCTASLTCADGVNTLFCSGDNPGSTCSSNPVGGTWGTGSVTCDGVSQQCPLYCPDSPTCRLAADCYNFCVVNQQHGACHQGCCTCF